MSNAGHSHKGIGMCGLSLTISFVEFIDIQMAAKIKQCISVRIVRIRHKRHTWYADREA